MNMKKKNLLIMCPGRDDATSFWRGVGPLSNLYKNFVYEKWDMQLCKTKEIGWSDLIHFDVLFFQRPFGKGHIEVIKMAKNMGIKVWVDYDDDLTSIPFSNPAHRHYADVEIQKNISWIAANADWVSVSTKELANKYGLLNKRVTVIENAWNDGLWPFRPVNSSTSKIILWRGSTTHDEDIDFYLPQMKQVSEEHPDWQWIFIGQPFWKVPDLIKMHGIVDAMDMPAYVKFISELSPSITIVPLAPNVFNQSKSNIAWQEASFAGSCAIVPAWNEWERPGTLNYSSDEPNSFYQNMKKAIAMTPHDRKKLADESWEHIEAYESLKAVNRKREEILETLTV